MKKKLTSLLCLILALTMVFTLAACGTENTPVEDDPVENKPVDEKPADDTQGEEEREPVELVFYSFYNIDAPGKEDTIAAVNEYLKEKLNTTVDFRLYLQSEYKEVVSTIFASGAEMDALAVGSIGVDFVTNMTKNAFLPLDDYIDEYLPGTKELLPEAAWAAYSSGGKTYGVCSIKDLTAALGMWTNDEFLADLGMEFPAEYNTFFDLVDWWKEVKAARDAKYPELANQEILDLNNVNQPAYWFQLDIPLGSYAVPLTVVNIPGEPSFSSIAADGSEVTSLFYTEEYREFCKNIRGLIDCLVINEFGVGNINQYTTDGQALGRPSWGGLRVTGVDYETTIHRAKNATATTSYMQSVGWALPVQCSNVERTLEVIELLNTDQYLATVLRFGPEGTGWTDKDNDGVLEFEGTANADAGSRYWYNWYGPGLGAMTASKAPEGYPANFAEMIHEMNAAGLPSANMGFVYDSSNVQTELAACNSVAAQYTEILHKGASADVDAIVDEFVEKLKASGMDTIIADVQSQLDAWRAENVK